MAWATYSITDDIEVEFYGSPVKCDYGVPGSPVWTEIEDIGIASVTILGVEITDEKLLSATFPALYRALMSLADEIDVEGWE